MDHDLVVGIDASTTGCKTIIWNLKGQQVSEGRGEIPLLRPRSEWHEQNAVDWYCALIKSLRIAIRSVDTSKIAGLCICPQRETFVTVNESGAPLRNAILWMDNRARDFLPDLAQAIGPERFHRLTGKPLSGNLTLLKLRWLKEFEGEVFRKTTRFWDVAAYLNHAMTGQASTGWGIADPTGLFDMRNKDWADDILRFLQIGKEQLPEAFPAGTPIGSVSPIMAEETGLPLGLPVFAGLGDGQAGGLALNILEPGACYLSLGTSVVSGTYSVDFITSRNFRTMFAGSVDGYSLETVILGGTYTIDWFLESFGMGYTLEALEDGVKAIPPGAEGLVLVPYWNSALNPYWDPKARGITIGWTGDHGPLHLYRAILEGIAFELRLHFEGVEAALGSSLKHLVVMGGGSRSDTWCQIIADVTGKAVHRSEVADATALGAGMICAYGAGLFTQMKDAANAMSSGCRDTYQPNHKITPLYSQMYTEVYKNLFPRLQPYISDLSDILLDALA